MSIAFSLMYNNKHPIAVEQHDSLLCLLMQGVLFNVEAIEADRIRVDRVWHKRDAKRVLLYKMVLNPRQKALLR